jgi:phosphatidylglycerophosphate synthase
MQPFFSSLLYFLPPALKPNTITITGFIFVLLNYVFIHLGIKGYYIGYIFGSFALIIYLLADNIDGMHARFTNQTSKLGGFLDQWIDSISLPLIAFPIMYSFNIKGVTLIFLLCLLTLSCFLLYIEQLVYGTFYKPAFGPNEILLLVIIGYFLIYLYKDSTQLIYCTDMLNIACMLVFMSILLSTAFVIRGIIIIGLHLIKFIVCLLWYSPVIFYGLLRKNITSIDFEIFYIITHAIIMGYLIISIYGNRNLSKPFTIKHPVEIKTTVK